MSTLAAFMLVIVYVGAIIVLIGYICAISPNILLEPDYSNISIILILVKCKNILLNTNNN